jgi:hypothetical protein
MAAPATTTLSKEPAAMTLILAIAIAYAALVYIARQEATR